MRCDQESAGRERKRQGERNKESEEGQGRRTEAGEDVEDGTREKKTLITKTRKVKRKQEGWKECLWEGERVMQERINELDEDVEAAANV